MGPIIILGYIAWFAFTLFVCYVIIGMAQVMQMDDKTPGLTVGSIIAAMCVLGGSIWWFVELIS